MSTKGNEKVYAGLNPILAQQRKRRLESKNYAPCSSTQIGRPLIPRSDAKMKRNEHHSTPTRSVPLSSMTPKKRNRKRSTCPSYRPSESTRPKRLQEQRDDDDECARQHALEVRALQEHIERDGAGQARVRDGQLEGDVPEL